MRKLGLMFAVLATIFLAGCGDDLYVDQAFVGTWYWTDNVQFTYVFEADGSGLRGDAQIQNFTWGTRDGVLVLNHGPAFADDELTYTFDGNMLNLTGDMGNFYYFRFVPDQNLVGTWVIFDGLLGEKTKYADGTGFYLPFLGEPDEREDFNWFNVGDLLIHHFGPLEQDMWTYNISGDVLNLESRQITGYTQEFVRGSFVQYSGLLGEWAWQDNEEWQYYFGEEAYGERGIIGQEMQLFWTTVDDVLVILCLFTFSIEQWRFTITGNILHLANLLNPGEEYSYVRM